MYKGLWTAPRRGTGLNKLTNKKDYSRQRTRDDSLDVKKNVISLVWREERMPSLAHAFCYGDQKHMGATHLELPTKGNKSVGPLGDLLDARKLCLYGNCTCLNPVIRSQDQQPACLS